MIKNETIYSDTTFVEKGNGFDVFVSFSFIFDFKFIAVIASSI